MLQLQKTASAGNTGTEGFPALAISIKIPFLVLAFVGMALGLVGSCNTSVGGFNDAYASTGAAAGLRHWQVKSYEKMITNDPGRILELTGAELSGVFRMPALERRDLPSVVWQYVNGDCVLDVYFQADKDGSVLNSHAAHFEMRNRDGEDAETSACLHSLVSGI
jgi:hypothetical protein